MANLAFFASLSFSLVTRTLVSVCVYNSLSHSHTKSLIQPILVTFYRYTQSLEQSSVCGCARLRLCDSKWGNFRGVNSQHPPPFIGHYVVYTGAVLAAVFALQLALNGRGDGLAPPTLQRSSERVEQFFQFRRLTKLLSCFYNIWRKIFFVQLSNRNGHFTTLKKLDHCNKMTFISYPLQRTHLI